MADQLAEQKIREEIQVTGVWDETVDPINVDGLTGVHNRRFFDLKMNELTSSGKNDKFCVMFFDIDHFKQVNDTYGHLAGDSVLREFARILVDNLRVGPEKDFVARYGGEEFAVIFSVNNLDKALVRAEKIRKTVENSRFRIPQGETKLTTSAGVGLWDGRETVDGFIKRLDVALYLAKNKHGRNNVMKAIPARYAK